MNRRITNIAMATAGCIFAGGLAWADDELPEGLEGYKATGEMENCVSTTRISSTKIIDDATIRFKMKGKKVYLNRLSHKCHGLRMAGGFSYRIPTTQLCRGEIITVLEPVGVGASCALGKFERLDKVEE